MTSTVVPLATSGTRDAAPAVTPSPFPSFWLLQAGGWLTFAGAMTLSRIGSFPLAFMVASKGTLALLGFLCSLVLWRVYRPLQSGETSLPRLAATSVAASYAMALVWSAAANIVDVPFYQWFLDRRVVIGSVGRLFSGSVYHAFALLAWSLAYFVIRHQRALVGARERALRAESLAQQARLEALRLQLNPHFLFNTLNAISTLVVEKRHDEAARMIARLSDFLRLSLTGSPRDRVPLADELDFVERYLEIERVRFGDRLSARFIVGDEARRVRVPVLILQPLVENAVRHSVVPREEGGRIEVSAHVADGLLHLAVWDDGDAAAAAGTEGRPASGAVAGESDRRRIGLANTRERLQQLYEGRASFSLRRGEQGGTVAEIVLPVGDGRAGARIDG